MVWVRFFMPQQGISQQPSKTPRRMQTYGIEDIAIMESLIAGFAEKFVVPV